MTEKNFEIAAQVFFRNVVCPKHKKKMIELEDGWFSVAWWCKECKCPYQLKLVKCIKWNKEVAQKQLDEILKNTNEK